MVNPWGYWWWRDRNWDSLPSIYQATIVIASFPCSTACATGMRMNLTETRYAWPNYIVAIFKRWQLSGHQLESAVNLHSRGTTVTLCAHRLNCCLQMILSQLWNVAPPTTNSVTVKTPNSSGETSYLWSNHAPRTTGTRMLTTLECVRREAVQIKTACWWMRLSLAV